MPTQLILTFSYITVLLLAGVTALYYAYHNPMTRFRNTLLSLFLLTLACYQILGVA